MKTLDNHYWNSRYLNEQTGWDLGKVSPPLQVYIDQQTAIHQAILIPGCGNAYEAIYLLEHGYTDITVIDLAPSLTEKLEQKLRPYIDQGCLNVICGDFFMHGGAYDLILEQTFFCAIDPSKRKEYAEKCYALLKPGGKVAGVLFNRTFEGGPPFGGSTEEYLAYFMPVFHHVQIEQCDHSAKPRAGSEVFMLLEK